MWLFNSSVGRKVVMSITGASLVLFLLFHASMNLVAIFSEEGYNFICEIPLTLAHLKSWGSSHALVF